MGKGDKFPIPLYQTGKEIGIVSQGRPGTENYLGWSFLAQGMNFH
jgi:hypothetical protein